MIKVAGILGERDNQTRTPTLSTNLYACVRVCARMNVHVMYAFDNKQHGQGRQQCINKADSSDCVFVCVNKCPTLPCMRSLCVHACIRFACSLSS